jgi:hypothetical protein
MKNWCICWFSRIFLLGILIFKGLTARRLYKSFSVKGLIFILTALHVLMNCPLNNDLTSCMQYGPSSEANTSPASQDIKRTPYNKKHKTPPIPTAHGRYGKAVDL